MAAIKKKSQQIIPPPATAIEINDDQFTKAIGALLSGNQYEISNPKHADHHKESDIK